MISSKISRRLPPYVSYRTFRNFLEGLQQQGIPARIDRSYWGERLSGSTGSQLLAALRFLNLADTGGVPSSRLKQLTAARGSQKTDILRQATSEAYAFVLQGTFDPNNATYSQLEQAFRDNYQLGGDVSRKCIKFFVSLATDAGIYLSPFVTKKSTGRTGSGTKKVNKKIPGRVEKNASSMPSIPEDENRVSLDKILITKFPAFDPAWSEEVKLKWFEGFDLLLKRFFQGEK
ncbi:MAG: DUF5343 domain-containing protein [Chloroflexi bacterium]|nr:DUF5343 domain-containing protein [Chloroflexota bacterium]